MPLTPPPPVVSNPIARMYHDLRLERAATVPFPPGLTNVDLRRASRFASTPLPILLDCYERFGPVFTIRVFHSNVVFMLGPEANHFMTVSARGQLLVAARASWATSSRCWATGC